jgi:hypothetical protein
MTTSGCGVSRTDRDRTSLRPLGARSHRKDVFDSDSVGLRTTNARPLRLATCPAGPFGASRCRYPLFHPGSPHQARAIKPNICSSQYAKSGAVSTSRRAYGRRSRPHGPALNALAPLKHAPVPVRYRRSMSSGMTSVAPHRRSSPRCARRHSAHRMLVYVHSTSEPSSAGPRRPTAARRYPSEQRHLTGRLVPASCKGFHGDTDRLSSSSPHWPRRTSLRRCDELWPQWPALRNRCPTTTLQR